MFDRILNALEAARNAVAEQEATPTTKANRVMPAWALIHIGDADDLESNVAKHEAECKAMGFRCVVISNHFPQSVLGNEAVIFEFAQVDATSTHDANPQAATHYLFDRLEHIVSYWTVVKCSWTGSDSAEIAELSNRFAPKHSILAM